jgi:Xaa-Pro aminopeptidase
MVKGHKYVIYAEDAVRDPVFVGFADTIEEARKIKFEAELAGYAHAAIADGNLNEVE